MQVTSNIGVACVTAGPGATNAVPGLASVDSYQSCPYRKSSQKAPYYDRQNIRTFGTAEINILPIVKTLTKYSATILDEKDTRYVVEKAFYEAENGRPGPVWIDVPLDIQNKQINQLTKGFIQK